eukprot:30804-Pelagococcus_subviridis.AAC.7
MSLAKQGFAKPTARRKRIKKLPCLRFVSFGGGIVPGAGRSENLTKTTGGSSVKVQSSSVISQKIGENGKWGVVPSKMKPK